MIKSEFYKMMEELCPNDLAESWDNCGIQINTEKDKEGTYSFRNHRFCYR